jgi:hypothetical protein
MLLHCHTQNTNARMYYDACGHGNTHPSNVIRVNLEFLLGHVFSSGTSLVTAAMETFPSIPMFLDRRESVSRVRGRGGYAHASRDAVQSQQGTGAHPTITCDI